MFWHEYDKRSNHRIVQVNEKGEVLNAGEWGHYTQIVGLCAGGRARVIAVTPYHQDCPLEPDRIYRVEAL